MSQDEVSLPVRNYEARVADLLNLRFSLQDLKDLCLDLNVDFENIAGSIKKEKAQELTKYFARREVLDQLVAAIKSARPDVVIEPPESKTSALKGETFAFIACVEVRTIREPAHSFKQLSAVSSIVEDLKSLPRKPPLNNSELEGHEATQNARVRVHSLGDAELVLISIGDAVALLQRIFQIASEAKTSGDFELRVGIHSAALPPNHAEDERSIPDEFIKLTKSTMQLGKAAHILATSHVAETVRKDPALKGFIHEATKCEVKYHVRVEIHNIYDETGGKFGNPAKPSPTAPTQILMAVDLPRELRCAKSQPITLTFSPDVDYARVVFGFRNTDLQISGEGLRDDDSYDYYPSDDNHTKSFEMWSVKASEEMLEPVSIRCLDEANELMAPPVRGRVLVRRRVPDPSGLMDVIKIPLWAWDRFICLPRVMKVVALLAAVVLVGGYAATQYHWNRYDQDKERLLIATHVWPPHYSGAWAETFTDTYNHRPSPEKWRDPPAEWNLVQQQGNYQNDKALLVHGERVGLNNLGNAALYDFTISLRFTVLASQSRIAWVLRAQNPGNYYLFVLTLPSKDLEKAKIEGSLYRDGQLQGQLKTLVNELPYDYPFPENTTLYVDIEVSANNFKHTFKSSLAESFINAPGHKPDPLREAALLEQYRDQEDFHVDFTDTLKSYRWGYIGFRALEPDAEMKIEEVVIPKAL